MPRQHPLSHACPALPTFPAVIIAHVEHTYYPRRQRAIFLFVSLFILALVLGFWLLAQFSNGTLIPWLALTGTLLAFLLGTLVLWGLGRVMNTHYTLSPGALTLRWGTRKEVFPLRTVDWARPLSDFRSPLPMPAFHLPGYVYGRRDVNGLGRTAYLATEKADMLLVSADGGYYLISPEAPATFLQHLTRLREAQTAPEQPARASENRQTLWSRVWQQPATKRYLIAGTIAMLLTVVLAAIFSTSQTEVTWVTLEQVPASRLALLAVAAVLIWLVDLAIGVFLFLQDQVHHLMIHLLWLAGVISCLILSAAIVLMSL